MARAKINERFGMIDTKGNWVIQPQFEELGYFNENGMARAEINEKCGMIDTKGNWVIQPQFEELGGFNENGMARAKINERFGMIDTKGNWVIQPHFEELGDFNENGMAEAKINEKWGMIDTKGNWVIQPQFEELGDFNENGMAYATIDLEKFGFIDTKGNWIIQPKFDWFYDIFEHPDDFDENGFSIACINDKHGLINRKGDWVIDPKYDRITWMIEAHYLTYQNRKTYYKVHSDGKVGFVGGSNLDLNIPLIFEDADLLRWKTYDEEEKYVDEEKNDNEEISEEDNLIDGIPTQNIDFDLFLSEYIDNRITFIGHEAVKKQIEKGYKNTINFVETIAAFNEGDIEYKKSIQDFTMASIEFHFIYRPWGKWMPEPSLIIVFSVDDLLMILLRGEDVNGNYAQCLICTESQLRVIEEKRYSAKIQIDDIQGYLKIDKRDGGLLSLPFSKWRYNLEDIINAINDMIQPTNPD